MATAIDVTQHKEFRKGEDYEAHMRTHKASTAERKCPRCFVIQCDFQFGEGNWSFYTTRVGALGMIQPAQDCGLFKLGGACGQGGCTAPATKRVGLVLTSSRAWAFNWTCEEHAQRALDRMS